MEQSAGAWKVQQALTRVQIERDIFRRIVDEVYPPGVPVFVRSQFLVGGELASEIWTGTVAERDVVLTDGLWVERGEATMLVPWRHVMGPGKFTFAG